MDAYGFVHIGDITSSSSINFTVKIELAEAKKWEKAVYIFLFGDEVMRVGSSKGKLGSRMNEWQRLVTNALRRVQGLEAPRSVTPNWEAEKWLALLDTHGAGKIYAREATLITTSVGTFRAYMDEESILINRHKPRMNRHKNR